MTGPRDQPRRLAPVLFGCGNIILGVTGLTSPGDHVPAYAKALTFAPLDVWWCSFIALGVFILTGPLSVNLARCSAMTAVGWWAFFAYWVWLTLPDPQVSGRAVAVNLVTAAWHLLLFPYRRDAMLSWRRPRDRT